MAWRCRSSSLRAHEPSEEEIWALIEQHDPDGTVEEQERVEWHRDLLAGRDLFGGFFLRSPLLERGWPDSSLFEEQAQWITAERVHFAEYYPLDRRVVTANGGFHEVLQPAGDVVEPAGTSQLLAHRLLRGDAPEWDPQSTLGVIRGPPAGYVSWARYVLQAHRGELTRAGIYGAVYATLFDYSHLPSALLRVLVEQWDRDTNTCWFGVEEFTLTLWELQLVSGLPIMGRPYEECVPPEEQLFGRRCSGSADRRGSSTFPASLPEALRYFQHIHRGAGLSRRASRGTIPTDVWMASFLRPEAITTEIVVLHDPFERVTRFGEFLTEETATPIVEADCSRLALTGMDEEVFLI